jgi:hypothetical protein
MKKLKTAFLLIILAQLQGCQQNERIQKPVLNTIELENLLKTNSEYETLVRTLNVSSNNYLTDLNSNYSKLPLKERERMNQIEDFYGSKEDFIKFATEEEKAIFQKLAPHTYGIAESITKLSNEVALRYSFEKVNLFNAIINLHNDTSSIQTVSGKVAGGCNSYCEHVALAEYYWFLDGGGADGAYIYATGVYVGCMRGCQ